MFEPIRARLASSCSRNGISAAATDTIWRGDTSMYWTLSGRHHREFVLEAYRDQVRAVNWFLAFSSEFACAMT